VFAEVPSPKRNRSLGRAETRPSIRGRIEARNTLKTVISPTKAKDETGGDRSHRRASTLL
jgi:hypothetical protein